MSRWKTSGHSTVRRVVQCVPDSRATPILRSGRTNSVRGSSGPLLASRGWASPTRLPEMLELALACEDDAHEACITTLCDRVLIECADWLMPEHLVLYRCWKKREKITSAVVRAKGGRRRYSLHGGFGVDGRSPEALLVRAQLVIWTESGFSGVAFVGRDLDGDPSRRAAWSTAMNTGAWAFSVIFAGFQPEAEAWLVAAFSPNTDEKRRLHADATAQLGFDPVARADTLTSTDTGSPIDAKSVCSRLLPSDRYLVLQRPLDELRSVCPGVGLPALLEDVENVLVPRFLNELGSASSSTP